MSDVSALIGSFFAMLIVGVVAKFVIARTINPELAKFGALCCVSGFALARFLLGIPSQGDDGFTWFLRCVGAAAAVICLSIWWNKCDGAKGYYG